MSSEVKFRVWHIPQVPMEPFTHEVPTAEEAFRLSEALALYDLFQYENRVKPDYSNATGVEVFYDGEWTSVDEEDLEDDMRYWEDQNNG